MTKRMLVATLALAGIFLSAYLALYKLGYIGVIACSIGSCETVQTSRWATFLGMPVAVWGVGFYVTAFVVAMAGVQGPFADSPRPSVALVALSGWGVLFSAWLTYLELFVIDAICMWCIVSAILVTIIFVVSLLDLRDWRGAEAVGDELGEAA
jgi:uncharacterized membrane protein